MTTLTKEAHIPTLYTHIAPELDHCFYEGYWCSQSNYHNQIIIENVKDAFFCQKECQETTEVLGCEIFSWDSITSDCILSQECDFIMLGYFVSGPRECLYLTKAPNNID